MLFFLEETTIYFTLHSPMFVQRMSIFNLFVVYDNKKHVNWLFNI